MSFHRRNVLAFLGLVAATGPALDTGAIAGDQVHIDVKRDGREATERIAQALDRLAAGIRSSEVLVSGLTVSSSIKPGELVVQDVNIEFILEDRSS